MPTGLGKNVSLFQVRTRETFENKISMRSKSSQVNFDSAHKQFDKFTKKTFNETFEQIIEDLTQVKDQKEQSQKTFDVLQNYVNYLDGKKIAASTIRIYFNGIKKYLKYRGFEIHTDDIKNEIDFPVVIEEQEYALKNKDIEKLISKTNDDNKMLYLVLSSSGMRIQETLRLRKRDFYNSKRIRIEIPGKYTKTKKARMTFVSSEAEKLLRLCLKKLKDDDLVFTNNEDYIRAKNTAEKYFERVRKKAGFTKVKDTGRHLVTLHSFRSFFITRCNRIDFGIGNALAGHGYYMKKYEQFPTEQKLEFYLKAEPDLLIYDDSKKDLKISELQEKSKEIDKLREKQGALEAKIERMKLSTFSKKDLKKMFRKEIDDLLK